MVLDMVVVVQLNPDLVLLTLHQPKVDLVVEVHGNMEMVLHLTKAHTLVGHLTETLVVTELVEKITLVLVEEELAVLVLTLLLLMEDQVVSDNYFLTLHPTVKAVTLVAAELVVLILLLLLPLVVTAVAVTVVMQVMVLVVVLNMSPQMV